MTPFPQPEGVEDAVLWRLLVQLLSRPTPRSKLPNLNSLADVVDLIHSSRKILVLTGAGVSDGPQRIPLTLNLTVFECIGES